ncbi:hypothetical protein AOQ84DRAFT_271515, partial [Glonium stellatum]
YGYEARTPLAVIAAVLFLGMALITIIQFFHRKTWCFWPIIIGALIESSGFIARAVSVGNPKNLHAFLFQHIAIILAPSWVAAACYLIFGRLVRWVTPAERRNFRTLWCPARFNTLFFGVINSGSFFTQLYGVSTIGTSYLWNGTTERREKCFNSGVKIFRIGLILQLVCSGIFLMTGTRFLVVSRYWNKSSFRVCDGRWRRLGCIVIVAAQLVTLQTVYRVLEVTGSRERPNYLYLHEWSFWIFDAVPIFVVLLLFSVVHPGHYLP